MKNIIQITKSGTVFSGTEKNLKEMQEQFNKQHCIKLSKFLEPSIVQLIQKGIEQAGFYEDQYKMANANATDYRLKDKTVDNLLRFLINDEKLFNFIERLTGCPKIGSFNGAVFSLVPGYNHYDSWHQDNFDNRMMSMSINLSTDVFSGGTLKIRDYKSKQILHEVTNTGFGDCVIFPVSPHMEHMVTSVTGTVARTAFPGWFRSKPSYKSLWKKPPNLKKTHAADRKYAISKYSTVTANKELFSRIFEGQTLIFNPQNTLCYSLDSIGAKVLNVLQEPMDIQKIKDIITNEYEVESEQCEQDILTLLEEFAVSKLITVKKVALV